MSKPVLKAGRPEPETDQVNIWVETGPSRIYLKARHSRDNSSQNIAIIEPRADGLWEISSRNLFTRNLCEALGVEFRSAMPISTEPEYVPTDEPIAKAEGRA